MEWIMAAGFGGVFIVIGLTAIHARRAFLRRIEVLHISLERTRGRAARTDLSPEVLNLARRMGISANEGGKLVRLTQSGQMWRKPGAQPMRFSACQIIAVAQVGFLWRAWFHTAGMSMQIIDYLVGGEAGLTGRLFDTVPLLNATGGDAMFRGEALRYLSEIIWAPDAILFNHELIWRVIDARTLAVATGEGTRRSEVKLHLNETGDTTRFEADERPYMEGKQLTNRRWLGRCSDYRSVHGRRIPFQGEVAWMLDGVEFVYWRGRIESWSLS